ncbi:MAG: hypothetical protein OXE86_00815 [Alphaproteobacteria bacterium]|nr:hypothetical protein [Alphaproteobacteria bacterium]
MLMIPNTVYRSPNSTAPTADTPAGLLKVPAARAWTVQVLAALLLAILLSSARTHAESIGFRDLRMQSDGEHMVAAVWYPTDVADGQTVEGPFPMTAVRNAPLAEGHFGLVLISHGTGGHRLGHRGTAIRLARAGYVVAAPEHGGDNWRDARYSGTAENWVRRPRQLRALLDRLLGDREFDMRIDPARIAAIGHSAGGYSVLALIGGRADMRVLASHCTRFRDRDPVFCSYGRPGGTTGGLLPDLTDRRIRAAVAVAPTGALFGPGAFPQVTVPVQIHRLGRDRVLRRPWHEDNIMRLLGDGERPVLHPEAHHFAFIAPFPASLIDEVGEPARDPPGFDRKAFLSRIESRILDFLTSALASE